MRIGSATDKNCFKAGNPEESQQVRLRQRFPGYQIELAFLRINVKGKPIQTHKREEWVRGQELPTMGTGQP